MIPFAILSGKIRTTEGEKEIRILELSPEYFTFRLLEKQAKKYVQSLSKAGQQSTIELSFFQFTKKKYHELILDCKTDVKQVELIPSEMETKDSAISEIRITVENEEYRACAEVLNREYMKYIYLKFEKTDAEVSQALTGYPAQKEQFYSDCFTQQREGWNQKLSCVISNKEKKIGEIFPTEHVENEKSFCVFGIELDNPSWYQAYMVHSLEEFLALYWDSSGLPAFHPLRAQRKRPDYLYIGNAYCTYLFPKEKLLFMLLEKAQQDKVCPVLVFAPVEEKDLTKIEKKLERLANWSIEKKIQLELEINDWGMAGMIRKKYPNRFLLTLGRLLSKQRRDTRLCYLSPTKERDIEETTRNSPRKEEFGQGPIQTSFYQKYLQDHFSITRVALQSCGYKQPLLAFSSGMEVTFHFPFFQMNTSGWCPLLARLHRGDRARQMAVSFCNCECMHNAFEYPDFLQMTGRYNSIFGYDDAILIGLMKPTIQKKTDSMKTVRLVAGFLNKPIKNAEENKANEKKNEEEDTQKKYAEKSGKE